MRVEKTRGDMVISCDPKNPGSDVESAVCKYFSSTQQRYIFSKLLLKIVFSLKISTGLFWYTIYCGISQANIIFLSFINCLNIARYTFKANFTWSFFV